ncbi:MAG: toll/interleukin-1 receptor domain-containing protein [Pirellulales bacterium]
MKDFFISYNSHDEKWAEWIAYVLEENGYAVVIQKWDFRPGNNFPIEMDRASKEAEKTIGVLSSNFLASQFTQPEWAARFRQDPTGEQRKLIFVRVENVAPDGLIGSLIYIDLVGRSEMEAERELIEGVRAGRGKPASRSFFPPKWNASRNPLFPGKKVDEMFRGEDVFEHMASSVIDLAAFSNLAPEDITEGADDLIQDIAIDVAQKILRARGKPVPNEEEILEKLRKAAIDAGAITEEAARDVSNMVKLQRSRSDKLELSREFYVDVMGLDVADVEGAQSEDELRLLWKRQMQKTPSGDEIVERLKFLLKLLRSIVQPIRDFLPIEGQTSDAVEITEPVCAALDKQLRKMIASLLHIRTSFEWLTSGIGDCAVSNLIGAAVARFESALRGVCTWYIKCVRLLADEDVDFLPAMPLQLFQELVAATDLCERYALEELSERDGLRS